MSTRGDWVRLSARAVAVVASVAILLVSCMGPRETAEQATTGSRPSEGAGSVTGNQPSTGQPSKTGPDAAAPEAGTDTAAPSPDTPPDVGECYRIDAQDLRTIVITTRSVPCRKRHTALTFHVGRLPARASKGAVSSGDPHVERAADRICRTRFRGYVGEDRADRRLSMVSPTYFLPSTKQFGLGARWVRCDVYAYATPSRVAALPRNLADTLPDSLSDNLGRCSPVSPSQPRFRHVICKQPHGWRAVQTVQLGTSNEAFPGRETVQARARARCEGRVRDYLSTDSAFEYGFEVPQRRAWRTGERLGLCWAKTSD